MQNTSMGTYFLRNKGKRLAQIFLVGVVLMLAYHTVFFSQHQKDSPVTVRRVESIKINDQKQPNYLDLVKKQAQREENNGGAEAQEYAKIVESGLLKDEVSEKKTPLIIEANDEEIKEPKTNLQQNHDQGNQLPLNMGHINKYKKQNDVETANKQVTKPPLVDLRMYQLLRGQQHQLQAKNQNENKQFELSELERVVHIDLKGAPPKPSYFEKFIPLMKKLGATGLLLEYEDMFPFTGRLAVAKNGNAYTMKDIEQIKSLAKSNGLYIIPLVQTYGHLEWLLKVHDFVHLRDASEHPEVISICLEESYVVLHDMIDQVIAAHPDAPFFHVGLDEVYYKLVHSKCRQTGKINFNKEYLSHLMKIASHVRQKLPNAKIFFWDDMIQNNVDENTLLSFSNEIKKYELIPMMWGYMENVETYFQPHIYQKYGNVFGKIWIASAYKGASSELVAITSVQHHYLNHLAWIKVMKRLSSQGVVQFEGVALTGWSRYDHFLQLCDILPEALPSLAFNLQTMQYGELDDQRKDLISTTYLGCSGKVPWFGQYMSYERLQCTFPGHEVYEAILPVKDIIKQAQPEIQFAKLYMQSLNLESNFLHKKRAKEVKQRLSITYENMINFKKTFEQACATMYYNDTAIEWLTVYFVEELDKVYYIMKKINDLQKTNEWKPRPLPVTLKPYPDRF